MPLGNTVDSTDPDSEAAVKTELRKLQHQYHTLENEYKIYCDEAQHLIRRQGDEISALLKEHKEIDTDMLLLNSDQNVLQVGTDLMEMKSLLESKDKYDRLIKKHKEHMSQLDTQIKEIEGKIFEKRKKMGGPIGKQRQTASMQKHIRVQESCLQQATVRFDKLLAKNTALREEIEDHRFWRDKYGNFFHKISRELCLQQQLMNKLVEQATEAYDQRSEALARALAVRDRSQKDKALFNTEVQELLRIIEHDHKLRNFMMHKSHERSVAEDDELKVAKKKNTEQRLIERVGGDSIESYQTAYQRVVELTGQENVDVIRQQFMENEEKNFAYFSYINELNNETEMLQEKIQKLQGEILQFQFQNKQLNEDRHAALKSLEMTLERTTLQANDLERQYRLTCKSLDQLKTGVESLFTKMNCDPSSIVDKLGGSQGITDFNIVQYIGILEHKTSDLMMALACLGMKEAEYQDIPPTNPLLGGSSLLSVVQDIKVDVPSAMEGSDADPAEILEWPLDLKSLHDKVLQKVLFKEELCKGMEGSKTDRGVRDGRKTLKNL
ncbi:coiled-coil domain-containing protein 63-like [Acipenser ruthenus]|uniref:coiled-coil domain-containing protein 63-like n=1 Tax=Acipenser ruthenus TaxID=7906 RepID=UPI00274246C5|nr:coiled-coil domain-containing protein 63-like [Acipenser ruthenus]